VGFIIIAFPIFIFFPQVNLAMLAVIQIGGMLLVASFQSVQPTVLSELFPTTVRYTGVGFSNNITVALFGGTAPLVATYLGTYLGNPALLAGYLVVCAAISTIAYIRVPETYKVTNEQMAAGILQPAKRGRNVEPAVASSGAGKADV
jgi:MFS family permease